MHTMKCLDFSLEAFLQGLPTPLQMVPGPIRGWHALNLSAQCLALSHTEALKEDSEAQQLSLLSIVKQKCVASLKSKDVP
jgi:hypothetical protein